VPPYLQLAVQYTMCMIIPMCLNIQCAPPCIGIWIICMTNCVLTFVWRVLGFVARKLNIETPANPNTEWQRLIGSPKLQIIFHKRATQYRSLLWRMTYKNKGSYESSPPCTLHTNVNTQFVIHMIHTNVLYLCMHIHHILPAYQYVVNI